MHFTAARHPLVAKSPPKTRRTRLAISRRMKKVLSALILLAMSATPSHAATADFGDRLSAAAIERTKSKVVYDPTYRRIAYPMGDVAADRGVCADEVVRALRALDVDLQALVHEDMKRNFAAYPQFWGLAAPDSNIDHRRVPNLETYMSRKGWRLAASLDAADYKPGDVIAWNLRGDAGFLPHIGIVTDRIGASGWPMVVHNIGQGPKLEDVLFSWPMTGRYRIAIAGSPSP